ncbi:MAG: prepilin peptidase [Candidatus Magasanikbacteria bacterium]|nr:prepilin peptidase [Candidatus Magasanikbacteria bacterium]
MTIFLLIVIGLTLGSFFNAWLYRAKQGESIAHGRSHCPHCKHVLVPIDLVPILSWLLLKAQCRYCKQKISWHYPAAEILGVVIIITLYFLIIGK